MEEIAESLGGNAKLLCSAATIAAERGLPGLLEQTRRGALPSSQGEQRDFASRKARWGRLQGLAEAALSVLGFLPGTLNVLALRSVSERIALDFPGGQISDRVAAASADAQWDETLRELLRDQCVRVDSGRVAISNDLRQSVHEMAGPTAADVADALAVVTVRHYRDFDDYLEADLLAARAQFRADQPILRWIAQTVDDGRMAILTAGILARYALHATEANVEQPLALALQRAEGVPRDVVDEGTYALADSYRVIGKFDKAEAMVAAMLRGESPRLVAVGHLTRLRIRVAKGEHASAREDIDALRSLRSHLTDREVARLLLGKALVTYVSGELAAATREFSEVREWVKTKRFRLVLPEVLSWAASNALLQLELGAAEILLRELDETPKQLISTYTSIGASIHRSLLRKLSGDVEGALFHLSRALEEAREGQLRLYEFDLLLSMATLHLLAGNRAGYGERVAEASRVASAWEGPERVVRALENHRQVMLLLHDEISSEVFCGNIEGLSVAGDMFRLLGLLAKNADREVASDKALIANLVVRLGASVGTFDCNDKEQWLSIERFGRSTLARLGIAQSASAAAGEVAEVPLSASYVVLKGHRIDLSQRPILRKVVLGLTALATLHPGIPISIDHLVPLVWQGEKILASAAKNRLHVALGKLRALGLSTLILSKGNGYVLNPSIPVVRTFDRS
jgi:hypothetical protein